LAMAAARKELHEQKNATCDDRDRRRAAQVHFRDAFCCSM
jgi:hypothetical protein